MTLELDAQIDFTLGMCPGIAAHLIPRNGAAKLVNYLIDEDGSPYKRSGTAALSPAFGAAGLTFLWDGWLAAGKRTVVANPSDFGVLSSNDLAVVNLGGSGLASPARAVEIGGILFIDGGWMYAGSRKTAAYSTGTVTTNSTATVDGAGTLWAANADAGMIATIAGNFYAVTGVSDDTHLTLDRPVSTADGAGQTYSLAPVVQVAGSVRTGPYAAAGRRLWSFEGNRAYFSAYGDPLTWNAPEDFHELTGGVQIIGGEGIGDTLMLFTTRGVWTVGNLAYEIVDDFGTPQQPESQAAKDLILWAKEGIAGWRDSLVVPAVDGVWLLGGSEFSLLSESIGPLYTGYVAAGCTPGLATVNAGHYFLPILSNTGAFVDMLVCRLDRPARVRGRRMWPWTVWRGAGASVRAVTTRVGPGPRQPLLLGGESLAGSRVLRFGAFEHDGAATDQDGAAVVPELVVRDWATGPGNENMVKYLVVRYEMVGAEGTVVRAYYGTAAVVTGSLWDAMRWDVDVWAGPDSEDLGFTELASTGAASIGDKPIRFRVGKKLRYIRPRLKLDGAATRFVVREVRVVSRPSGRM